MPMIKNLRIEYLYDSDLWDSMQEDRFVLAMSAVLDVVQIETLPPSTVFDVVVTFTADSAIRGLNKTHRGIDKATNVLSFPAYDPDEPRPPGEPVHLGDVVLAYETIMREAVEQSKDFHDHVTHLLVHGVLHLLGYDHEEDGEAEEMEALEISILNGLGIKNPYQDA